MHSARHWLCMYVISICWPLHYLRSICHFCRQVLWLSSESINQTLSFKLEWKSVWVEERWFKEVRGWQSKQCFCSLQSTVRGRWWKTWQAECNTQTAAVVNGHGDEESKNHPDHSSEVNRLCVLYVFLCTCAALQTTDNQVQSHFTWDYMYEWVFHQDTHFLAHHLKRPWFVTGCV